MYVYFARKADNKTKAEKKTKKQAKKLYTETDSKSFTQVYVIKVD